MSGSPAAAIKVGSQSRPLTISFETQPAWMRPGQRIMHGTRNAPSQLVYFFAAERRRAGVWPGALLGCVVGAVKHARVIRDAKMGIQRLKDGSNRRGVLDHPIIVFRSGRQYRTHMRDEMHAGGVEPAEKGGIGCHLSANEIDCGGRCLVVDRLHALFGERAGILDCLFADPPPARLLSRIVVVGGLAAQYAAGSKPLAE